MNERIEQTGGSTVRELVGAAWRYEIIHGPDGEQNYAWVYRGKELVGNLHVHHATAICNAMEIEGRLATKDAALTAANARAKRAEAENADIITDIRGDSGNIIAHHRVRIDTLKAENERFREALKFYAKEANWRHDFAPEPINVQIPGTAIVDSDCGQRARRALEDRA